MFCDRSEDTVRCWGFRIQRRPIYPARLPPVTALLVLPLLGAVFGLMVGYLTVMRTQNAMDDRLDRIEQFFSTPAQPVPAAPEPPAPAHKGESEVGTGKHGPHPRQAMDFTRKRLERGKSPASHKPTASAAGRIEVCRKPDFSAMPEGIIFRSDFVLGDPMKAHKPAVVVFECVLLFVVLLVAGEWIGSTFFHLYSPSSEHESVVLREYSARPVIESFAVPYSIEMGEGVSSAAGSKFVTNERTIDSTFAVKTDHSLSFMNAMSEDVAAQFIRKGATIVATRVGHQGEYQLAYRDGTSAGSVVCFPLADVQSPNQFPTVGTQKVRSHIVISEKWFPREMDAIRASTQPQ